MVTVVILALVSVFLALRLYAVLGKRTGHEQQPLPRPAEERLGPPPAAGTVTDISPEARVLGDPSIGPAAQRGLKAIMAADSAFDPARFLEGAKYAYRMVLEAYWSGDEAQLAELAGDDVRAAFFQAIADRKAAGHVLDNRLVAVERAMISDAELDGQMARITVRFDADIAAVTRDGDGNVIAGSLSDAVPTHDVWTFSRHIRSDDPNWLLVETDEAA
ncbi:Tim44/TimA family putative adaptor protein [Sphingomonas cavernae]|uniref:Tim44 domain-containing protein n=1 Tax=Sphingomonas cavernae TaxID=2320861 RepID=A0A418WLK3_9SPHN|nr:Tim44/TimA family putative adaptor protein [Sphingomonas cavernae]RJF90926.1 Tim44 domain-containing protein [Sphingomonas cavernae]